MAQTKLQHWYDEVWNNANKSKIDELMDENAVIHGLEIESEKHGPQAFHPFYENFRQGFPSVNVEIEPIITTDDAEAAHCTVNATTSDGKKVTFNGLTVAKFRDGKLVEGWNAFDFLTMQKQLQSTDVSEFEQPR
ncbi:MAG TPA: ester cyclase [Flavitalea sp.]|nr:ester cyclase [Flavitalea sp.]